MKHVLESFVCAVEHRQQYTIGQKTGPLSSERLQNLSGASMCCPTVKAHAYLLYISTIRKALVG
jgi:hypothetical protein